MTPAPRILAHGINGRQDLPLPFHAVLIGAALALVVSFAALGVLWSTSRLRPDAGHPVPARVARFIESPGARWGVRVVGLVVCGWFLAAGLFGRDVDTNPYPGAVFVLLWVGLVPLSVLLGPVWRAINPLRTVHALLALMLRTPPEEGLLPLPARVGQWPAAFGLFSFVWLELVKPDAATLPVLRVATAAYAGVLLIGAAVFGAGWFAAADPFEAWSGMFGRFSPLGTRTDGVLVLRNPLAGVAATPIVPGTIAVITVMLGSTAWDSWAGSLRWIRYVQVSAHRILLGTAGLVGTIAVITLAFALATVASGSMGDAGRRRSALPGLFVHSLLPVALGYVVAHYYSFLVDQGQRTVILATDPLQTSADYLGLRDASVHLALIRPRVVAALQVTSVVTGHVLGVVLAHDRAVRLFDRRRALLGQVPLLLLMVGYTIGGLLLLFHG